MLLNEKENWTLDSGSLGGIIPQIPSLSMTCLFPAA